MNNPLPRPPPTPPQHRNQVIHFLGPPAVEQSFAQFFRCLTPGGKLVLLACGHYIIMNFSTGRVAEIEEAMKHDPEGAHGYHPPGNDGLNKAIQVYVRSSWVVYLAVGPFGRAITCQRKSEGAG
jgi:hypothetical protein